MSHHESTSRHNFYHIIHKGLRLGHSRNLAAIGSTDFSDQAASARLIAGLREYLDLAQSHLMGENREIHAALETRVPGASANAAEDHEHHEHSFAELEALLLDIEAAPAARREQAGRALYRRYALFAAEDYVHMNEEETDLLQALQDAFSDEELLAIEGRIVGAIAPPKMMAYMRLMVPAINHGERVGFIGKLKAAMPPQVFEAVVANGVRPSLEPVDFAALAGALDIRVAA